MRLLDLIPSGTMDGSGFQYLREVVDTYNPAASGSAAFVQEGEVKPATSIEFEDAEAKAQTIAVWTKLLKQSLSDVSALDSAVRFRLMRKVMSAIEAQIVNGDGTGQSLEGILHTPGVYTADVSDFGLAPDAIL